MKLLFCKKCHDVFSLKERVEKTCSCGAVAGMYLNTDDAYYRGDDAVPLGFGNSTFVDAIRNQPKEGMGERFLAFSIPKECPTFKKKP